MYEIWYRVDVAVAIPAMSSEFFQVKSVRPKGRNTEAENRSKARLLVILLISNKSPDILSRVCYLSDHLYRVAYLSGT